MSNRYAVYSVMYHGFNWEAVEVLGAMVVFVAICVAVLVVMSRKR